MAAAVAIAVTAFLPSNTQSADDFHTRVLETYEISDAAGTMRVVGDSAFVALADSIAGLAAADEIISRAKDFIGVRYRWGSTGPDLFDCSGFTSYVYRQQDIEITRTSRSQYMQGKVIRRVADLRRGDLVFFGGEHAPRRVGHVGIVTEVDSLNGCFKFIHASRTGVQVDNSSCSYYASRYLGARRIIGA